MEKETNGELGVFFHKANNKSKEVDILCDLRKGEKEDLSNTLDIAPGTVPPPNTQLSCEFNFLLIN